MDDSRSRSRHDRQTMRLRSSTRTGSRADVAVDPACAPRAALYQHGTCDQARQVIILQSTGQAVGRDPYRSCGPNGCGGMSD